MTTANKIEPQAASPPPIAIPEPILIVFRGIGQIMFQESALTGALFTLGIALSSPLMAGGLVVGAAIGTAVAWVLKFDRSELNAGIYGFNSALVGIASLFFFLPGPVTIGLMVAGCVVAALVTYAARRNVPFPTYTAPFVVTTWAVFFLGKAMGAVPVTEYPLLLPNLQTSPAVEATAHGIGQVMLQASVWTGLLFLIGIAVNDSRHAAWVLAGSVIGMLLASYHVDAAERAIDPEKLVERDMFENIRLGLYGYNATLAAVALYLWRRSLIPPLLGILLSVPITEFMPRLGVPALTAPFVLATWIVLALGCLERAYIDKTTPRST
jgi:urea transporter